MCCQHSADPPRRSTSAGRRYLLPLGGTNVGWMGLRSTPMTSAIGYASPMSTHQIPVPVPKSRILLGFSPIGAKCSLSPQTATVIACFMSSRSCSCSSLGNTSSFLLAIARNMLSRLGHRGPRIWGTGMRVWTYNAPRSTCGICARFRNCNRVQTTTPRS